MSMKPTYEQLEQQLAAVVAENAGAKKVISECREYFIAGVMNRIRPTNEGYLHMICDTFADETPATDAYLAEVRAQGVDAVKQKISDSIEGCYQDEMVGLDVAINIADEFAAQLRQGAEHE